MSQPTDSAIADFLTRRAISRAVYDFIAHNLVHDAAIAACLVGRTPPSAPTPTPKEEPCCFS